MRTFLVAGLMLTGCNAPQSHQTLKAAAPRVYHHQGICDASAAISLNQRYFLLANDEDNQVRLYDRTHSGPPVSHFKLSQLFKNIADDDELDLEAATEIDGVQYWLTSHGRNSKGRLDEMRYRFFATKIFKSTDGLQLKKIGFAYESLLEDMLESPALAHLELHRYTRLHSTVAPYLAPKKSGLNIEALSRSANGRSLLIGLRNPIPGGEAILIPLSNPRAVLHGEAAQFGRPYRFDFQSDQQALGIRSIEYVPQLKKHLIVAGASTGEQKFQIYWWKERHAQSAQKLNLNLPENFYPEAANFVNGRIELYSDDGNSEIQGRRCKNLSEDDPGKQFQRMLIKTE